MILLLILNVHFSNNTCVHFGCRTFTGNIYRVVFVLLLKNTSKLSCFSLKWEFLFISTTAGIITNISDTFKIHMV